MVVGNGVIVMKVVLVETCVTCVVEMIVVAESVTVTVVWIVVGSKEVVSSMISVERRAQSSATGRPIKSTGLRVVLDADGKEDRDELKFCTDPK